MKTMRKLTLFALMLVLLASCTTPSRITYLRDMEYNKAYAATKAPELRLHPEDQISIQVLSTDPALAAPFNASSGAETNMVAARYTLDKDGNIDFPVLGIMHIEGMTINEVKAEIADRIIKMGYIREPIVKVEFSNFRITVLGEGNNAIINVTDESINLLQVIARTGYVGDRAKVNDVMVIRTVDGQREAYTVNLQTKDLFDSPVFYLQQNDIVYVKPRGLRTNMNLQAIMSGISPLFSITSILSTLLLWATVK